MEIQFAPSGTSATALEHHQETVAREGCKFLAIMVVNTRCLMDNQVSRAENDQSLQQSAPAVELDTCLEHF